MKKMMMALAALCVAGAASAVSYSWSNLPEEKITNASADKSDAGVIGSADFSEAITDGTKWAIRCTMTVSNVTAVSGSFWPVMVGIGGTNNDPRFFVNPDDNSVRLTNGSGSSLSGDTATGVNFAAGTYNFAFSYDNGTVSVYLNGKSIASFTKTEGSTLNLEKIQWGAQKTNEDPKNNLNKWCDWDISGLQYVNGATYAEMVPEPTALALLALGVAGLALRRKAA